MTTTLPKPAGLKARGSAMWLEVAGTWTLRSDEVRVLEHACRTLDELDRLQREFAKTEPLVAGSMGQLVPNPLGREVRSHRDLLAKLLRQLNLPDPAVASGEHRSALSEKRSAAAKSRWDRVRALKEAAA